MISTQTKNKQASKKEQQQQQQKKANNRNKLCNEHLCVCIVLFRDNEKNCDFIQHMCLYLLPCFCIFFKKRLGSLTKVFMSKVVLTNLIISEPIDA